ncbi:imidazole glycerol phosphate synthase subunit HisF [Candidatus Gracilibacteria bacterium]|nr:imidazole glycerol phosphate synthase subunit HisF [Candidatus Gracilibacteria bacterium]
MLVIPAIDILDGKCVRLFKGDYNQVKQYADDPVEVARKFERDGAKLLHIVDLDGAKEGSAVNAEMVLDIAKAISIPLQIGGGIRDLDTATRYLENGIDRIILGTSAVMDQSLIKSIIERFGSDRLVVSVDIKDEIVAIKGWIENSDLSLDDFLEILRGIGVKRIIVTDVSRDGALTGPNYDLVEGISGFKVISAGGVSCDEDLKKFKGIEGAIVGKAIYEGTVRLVKNNLAKRIIPCMDVENGRVVKGTNFVDLKDAGDPVELGKFYSESGADELVFLDITATVEKRATLVDLVSKISKNVFIPFTVGGGIKSVEDIRTLLNAGADKVSIGSEAVRNPEFVRESSREFGSQCIVISLDCKLVGAEWELFVKGGREATGIEVIEFARKMEEMGAGELLVNSLDRDGTGKGFDLELLTAISKAVNIPVIASSGAGCKEDFLKAFQVVDACLAASLFHYGKLSVVDLKGYLSDNYLTIRKGKLILKKWTT